MEFELSKPQRLLQKSVRDLFSRECPPTRVRELMATDTAFDQQLWSAVADQGWLGIHLDESCAGLGLGTVELAVVSEEMGRACFPGPFLGTVWAATLLAALRPDAPELEKLNMGELKAAVALLEAESDWNIDSVQLDAKLNDSQLLLVGTKSFVLDADVADLFLVVARTPQGLVVAMLQADTPGLSISPTPAIDATRKLADVTFDQVTIPDCQILATGKQAEAAIARSLDIVSLAACAEMLGGMQWILEDSVEYAKTRQQFGKTIGTFQAVQHMCADMLLLTESSRSAIYYAAWAIDANAEDASRAVAIAKIYASDASREVANRGIQVHGGIGFTWEHDLQLYYRRSKALEIFTGDATHHRARLAEMVLDS